MDCFPQNQAVSRKTAAFPQESGSKIIQNVPFFYSHEKVIHISTFYTVENFFFYVDNIHCVVYNSVEIWGGNCCFAGGEDNLQRAGEIYHSIALSDITNAAYAADYAQFLINNTLQYDKADKWLHLALRHSTDSLQQAELYSKIGLICTYSSEKIQASPEYLQKAKTIYENLSQQDSYSNDAHFNISYADLFINMSQYWILQPDIYEGATNASDLLYEGFGYATSKTSTFTNSNGEIKAKTAMYWTQKGRMFLYELLKAKGYVPEVEKN